MNSDLQLLQLLHLADSALPIGTLAHSWGLETLVDDGVIAAGDVRELVNDLLEEQLFLEAVFCRAGYRAAGDEPALAMLNSLASARKPGRETRDASLAMGRRFIRLLPDMESESENIHYSVAFGAVCSRVGIAEDYAALAFLEQSCASILSCLVRLLPLGQARANSILWQAKPRIVATAQLSRGCSPQTAPCFTPALDIAAMRHPLLETRLFVS